jgi:prepilin-type N-terminal cleavage/methylation domain-containing protein
MSRDSRKRGGTPGFTLIEVLAAILIVSLVFGLLLEAVTRNLRDLSRARAEARAAQLAENRLRDLRADLDVGTKVDDGIKEGVFDAPDDDLHWRITIVPQKLLLPADYRGEMSPSPVFQDPAGAHMPAPAPTAPPVPGQDPNEPPLRLVQVRVFTENQDPDGVEPFVVLLTTPAQAAAGQTTGQPGKPGQPGQTSQPGQPGTTPQNGLSNPSGMGTGMGGMR